MQHRRKSQHDWRLTLFFTLFIACIVGYFAYIVAYGVNVVYWDDWAWAALLRDGQPTFASLWAQHNESIILFPNLLAYLVIRLTAWNSIAFFWISGVLLLGALALITRVFWEEIRRSPLPWIPLPFIVLTLGQYQSTLWAFQIAWFLTLLCVVGTLYLLVRPNLSTARLIGAAVVGVVGSYSLLQGLLVWPAGLVLLCSKGRSGRVRAIWSAIGVVAIAGYFVHYKISATNSASTGYILGHLSVVFQGLLLTAGNVVPSIVSITSSIYSPFITELIGAFLLIAGVGVVVSWLRESRPGGPKAFCVALIVTSLLFELLLIPSRLAFEMFAGTQSRYDTFMWPLLLGTYAYVVMRVPTGPPSRRLMVRASQISVGVVVGAVLIVGTAVGIDQGRVTRSVRLTSVDVLANWRDAPPAVAAPYLLPPCGSDPAYCTFLKEGAAMLSANHMSIFSDPNGIRGLLAEGVVPGGVGATPLPVPSALRSRVRSSPSAERAWDVLSTVYRSDPSLAREYPPTPRGLRALLLWASASGRAVRQLVSLYEWAPPVLTGFFLLQYAATYQAWASRLT